MKVRSIDSRYPRRAHRSNKTELFLRIQDKNLKVGWIQSLRRAQSLDSICFGGDDDDKDDDDSGDGDKVSDSE